MFCLSNAGNVRLSRGDSAQLPITFHDGTSLYNTQYILQENDEVYFGLMEPNSFFETALLRKKYTYEDVQEDGSIIVNFEPEDTQYLLPGLYYYQVKVRLYDPQSNKYLVNTVLPKTQFWIEE